jgi:hypothetical protein
VIQIEAKLKSGGYILTKVYKVKEKYGNNFVKCKEKIGGAQFV